MSASSSSSSSSSSSPVAVVADGSLGLNRVVLLRQFEMGEESFGLRVVVGMDSNSVDTVDIDQTDKTAMARQRHEWQHIFLLAPRPAEGFDNAQQVACAYRDPGTSNSYFTAFYLAAWYNQGDHAQVSFYEQQKWQPAVRAPPEKVTISGQELPGAVLLRVAAAGSPQLQQALQSVPAKQDVLAAMQWIKQNASIGTQGAANAPPSHPLLTQQMLQEWTQPTPAPAPAPAPIPAAAAAAGAGAAAAGGSHVDSSTQRPVSRSITGKRSRQASDAGRASGVGGRGRETNGSETGSDTQAAKRVKPTLPSAIKSEDQSSSHIGRRTVSIVETMPELDPIHGDKDYVIGLPKSLFRMPQDNPVFASTDIDQGLGMSEVQRELEDNAKEAPIGSVEAQVCATAAALAAAEDDPELQTGWRAMSYDSRSNGKHLWTEPKKITAKDFTVAAYVVITK